MIGIAINPAAFKALIAHPPHAARNCEGDRWVMPFRAAPRVFMTRTAEERKMRMLASAIAAAAVMGTASLTYAATATGKITDINQTKHLIALDTGSKFSVPASSLGDRQPAKLE